jgi:hypothetical protein
VDGLVVEARAVDEDQPPRIVPIDAAPGGNVRRIAPEQHGRRGRIGAAPPEPHGARVAGARGHAVAAEGGREQQRVAVQPLDAALGLGQSEAVRDKPPLAEIELTQHHGVAATAGQPQHGSVVRAGQGRGALPDPVLALVPRQGVEVDHDVPLGRGPAVGLEGRAPPEPARVRRVLPQVVQP